MNAVRPAPLAARHVVGHLAPMALFAALAKVIPNQVMAEGSASIVVTQTRGVDRRGRAFTFFQTSAGGTGARPRSDGLDNTGFPSGVAGVAAEIIEVRSPLILHERSIRCDSGGAGRSRGGLGQTMRFTIRSDRPWTIAALFDRIRFAPRGYLGGAPGAKSRYELSDGSHPDPKIQQILAPDTGVTLTLAGGGGFRPAVERDPELVMRDVVDGKVSVEAAEREYGVVVRCALGSDAIVRLPADFTIDHVATDRCRAILRA